ncbi:MAG: hypothetical protein JWM00_181 [Candidatus Saccharibacteria bacterium]|nr:hypothetical protein [Candidatus Saccharibacteria bacterium]
MRISNKLLTNRRNFVSWNRRYVTFRRHLPVVLRPLFLALIGTLLWKFLLYDNHFSFGEAAENPLLFIILPLVSFVYVIFASIAIGSVFDEYKIISRAVVKRDLETFLLHRDEQLPILLHILVAIPSLLLVALSMAFHYSEWGVGAVAVFSVIFIVVTAWIVATELDDFQRSIWFRESTPEEWHEIDVAKYFDEKRSK